MSRLIINNVEIELSPSKPIARTLQVNDIATLNNRQANFTPTFSIPRTAKNVRAMEKLGIIGTNSNVPYQRNECYYYSESGECLIYKGWAVITSTAKDYKCNVYDGNIDLYKSIENETLNALPLDEINHIKTLDNVVDSINGLTTYKYILADYNGKALYDTDKINIDYLVPSIPVSYLWDKIFEYYGYTYSGSIFDTFAFQNLYMTFPKGLGSTIPDFEVFEGTDVDLPPEKIEGTSIIVDSRSRYLKYAVYTNDASVILDNERHIVFTEGGLYRVEITGDVDIDAGGFPVPTNLRIAYNQQGVYNSFDIVSSNILDSFTASSSQIINVNTLITVNDLDSMCLFVKMTGLQIQSATNTLNVKVSKVESQTIDFSGAFLDFKTKDFLNEVLTRFGLTPFKDKYTNNYRFLTLSEVLQNTDAVDWSASKNKFVEQTNESYVYGSYAQKNDLTYKYNDAEGDYYNGFLSIDNVNLPDNKVVINSRIYAPEKIKTNVLPKETNVYKLWNKEVKDNGDVTYKSLDKRFYFMRADNFIFDSSVTIGSETLATETTIGQALFESFYKLPFNDIVQDFYLPMYQILNKSRLCDINVFLTEKDIVNIDFSKLYWIEELGNYFILNKINNFTKRGITKCEMIKVDYVPIIDGSNIQQLLAIDETFDVNNFDEFTLNVLSNDLLGAEPTIISSFDDSTLTCGTITNEVTGLKFTPNGIFDVTETFTYTIKDSLLNESTAVVTLNVSEVIIEDGFKTIGSPVNIAICSDTDFLSCKFRLSTSGIIQNGDICLNNDFSVFNGFNNYFKVYLSSDTLTAYNVRINSSGIITVNTLC